MTVVAPARTAATLRVGVVLAALQAAGNIALGITQWSADTFGLLVCSVLILGGAAALVLAVPAWRGVRRAAAAVAVVTFVASLTGLPAFVVPGVPAAAVIAAAVGIVLAVVTAALLLVPRRS